jgi:hypothetical protein
MLTDGPGTGKIFAASRQLDLILQLCKLITLQRTSAQRQCTLETFMPAFAALRWLNAERFGESSEIGAGIEELEGGAIALANLKTGDPPVGRYPPKACPVCGVPPISIGKRSPVPYCPNCLKTIMPGLEWLRSTERGFGTDCI